MPEDLSVKVYVGGLPRDCDKRELEEVFEKFGPLTNVWIAKDPPGFAFITFKDSRDADDAVKDLDGTTICGSRARVEHSSGKTKPKPWQRNGADMGPRGGPPRGYDPWYPPPSYGGGYGGPPRRRSRSPGTYREAYRPRYSRSPPRRRSRSRSRSPGRRASPRYSRY